MQSSLDGQDTGLRIVGTPHEMGGAGTLELNLLADERRLVLILYGLAAAYLCLAAGVVVDQGFPDRIAANLMSELLSKNCRVAAPNIQLVIEEYVSTARIRRRRDRSKEHSET